MSQRHSGTAAALSVVFGCAALLACGGGCQSSGGGGSGSAASRNTGPAGGGGATVSVLVRAEPKAGYQPPPAVSPEDDNPYARAGQADDLVTGQFTRVNYFKLRNVVVWLEPAGVPAAGEPAPGGDATFEVKAKADRDPPVQATSVGGTVRVVNRSDRPQAVFLRSEAGQVWDVGDIAPGAEAGAAVPAAGPAEVVAEGDEDDTVIGLVYAAPSGWVQRAASGTRVSFSVPPGRYVAHCWHPRLPGASQPVEATPGKLAKVTLAVGVNALPEVGAGE
jgi:hypothetical protein